MDRDLLQRFGDRMRQLRVARKLSQEALADEAGLDRSYIGGVERGERNVSLSNIAKIAGALGVELGELMAFTTTTEGPSPRRRRRKHRKSR